MSLARNIRFLRKKQGWSQDDLADKLGYKSYTTIQKWESGVSEPPLKIVHILADIFHIAINDLTNVDLENGEVSKPDILAEVDVAFYGEFKELDEDEQETVRDMVRLMRQRKEKRSQ